MLTHDTDVTLDEIPDVLSRSRLKDRYDFRLLPGGHRMGNGERRNGVRAELSWLSTRNGAPLRCEVEYSVNCSRGKIWISRSPDDRVEYFPRPDDYDTFLEFSAAWRDADVENAVQARALELGRYQLLVTTQIWQKVLCDAPSRHTQGIIEDLERFVDEAMESLVTQFPDEEHVFPMSISSTPAALGM
jgi:hypothetical protein